MRKKEQKKSTEVDRRSSKARRLGVSLTVILCTTLLAGGFFFAARQHFMTMDYGMKNSRLRKQLDQLEAEKRRLIHAREVSLSAPEIKKAARKVGLFDKPAELASQYASSADPAGVRASAVYSTSEKPLITKTAATAPVPPIVKTAAGSKPIAPKPESGSKSKGATKAPESLALSRPRLASTLRAGVDK